MEHTEGVPGEYIDADPHESAGEGDGHPEGPRGPPSIHNTDNSRNPGAHAVEKKGSYPKPESLLFPLKQNNEKVEFERQNT